NDQQAEIAVTAGDVSSAADRLPGGRGRRAQRGSESAQHRKRAEVHGAQSQRHAAARDALFHGPLSQHARGEDDLSCGHWILWGRPPAATSGGLVSAKYAKCEDRPSKKGRDVPHG